MAARKPTVLDVAREANVGASTVSRCLRHGPYVSEDVRKRVMAAVKLLGYEPNEVARSLRGGRSNSIAVIFPQITNPFFSLCVQQIEREASERGSTVILLTHHNDPEKQSRQLAAVRRSRCDGVILVASLDSNLSRVKKALHGIPVVALDRPLWKGADVVMLQHQEAACLATTHLLEHGLREVTCVTTMPDAFSFQERIKGYEAAMRRAGLTPHLMTASSYPDLRSLTRLTLQSRPAIDGFLALSNMATVSVLKGIKDFQETGCRPIGLIGFDDSDVSTLVQPALSMIVQPTDLMAHESVKLLFTRIENRLRLRAQSVLLPATLLRRDSCGCTSALHPGANGLQTFTASLS